jgi:hypothetical protein
MGYSNPELDKVIDELVHCRSGPETGAWRQSTSASPSLTRLPWPGGHAAEIAMRDNIEGYVQLPDNLLWYYPLDGSRLYIENSFVALSPDRI